MLWKFFYDDFITNYVEVEWSLLSPNVLVFQSFFSQGRKRTTLYCSMLKVMTNLMGAHT